MRKVILFVNITLDGFLCGPDGELDWMLPDPEMNIEFTDAMRARVDTILSGRVAHEQLQANFRAQAADPASPPALVDFARWMIDTPSVVFSRSGAGDLVAEVEALKALPGKDMVLFGGAGTAQEFARQGLVDEYWLKVYPVALGAGRPLFTERTSLTLKESKTWDSGIVTLRYE